MSQTKPYTIYDLWNDLRELFRFSYDPVKDWDGLPSRGSHSKSKDMRTATTDTTNVHEGPDKLYARKTTTNDSGATVFELDSTDVRTASNVPEQTSKYDEFVFAKFKESDKYKHFDWELYELIKREGFSKCADGQPLGYRKAAQVKAIADTKGCSERYVANYFKAMHIAFNLQLKNAPLPQKQG